MAFLVFVLLGDLLRDLVARALGARTSRAPGRGTRTEWLAELGLSSDATRIQVESAWRALAELEGPNRGGPDADALRRRKTVDLAYANLVRRRRWLR